MTRTAKPLNQKRLVIIRVVHLRVNITTLFTWFLYEFSSFKVNIGIASARIFYFLFRSKFMNLPVLTHFSGMATKTIRMGWSALVYIAFSTRCFYSHGGII